MVLYINPFKIYLTKKIYKNHGFYLIELIISMVIISISFTSVIMATYIINKVPSKKYLKQATQIAANYLHEIIGKDFPTTIPCINNNSMINPCNNLNIDDNLKATCSRLSAPRNNYTNVCQYDNLINYGAKDLAGDPILGLEDFIININVITSDEAKLDNLAGGTNLDTAKIVRIDVTVSRDNLEKILLSSYKSKYL